jgi:hypothetical protein
MAASALDRCPCDHSWLAHTFESGCADAQCSCLENRPDGLFIVFTARCVRFSFFVLAGVVG